MRLRLLLITAALAAPTAAAAASDVASFVARGEHLMRLGPLAAFSTKEMDSLFGEMNATTRELRAERVAAIAAGKPPAYCPPADNKPDPRAVFQYLETIPPAQRVHMPLKDGMRQMYQHWWPCRGGGR
jgi:hypothetical protein